MAGRDRRWALRNLGALAVVLVTFLCFRPALRNGFVDWDDPRMLLEGQDPVAGSVVALLRGVHEAWRTTRLGEYMPVTWMSYAVDRAVWGLDPLGYHLTSVLLHGLAALSVYRLALLLIPVGQPWIEAGAGLAALGFALHPLRVEPVAWSSARGTVLGALLLLLAVVAYVAGARRRPGRALPAPWLGLSLGLYVGSLLARATGAVLPVVLVLLDFYPLRRLGGGRGGMTGAAARPIWGEKLWYAAPALASGVLAVLARSWSGDQQRAVAFAPASTVVDALYGPAFYLWRTLVPLGLSPVYEQRLSDGVISASLLAGAATTVGITVGLVSLRRRFPAALVAWLCSLVLLLPVSGLVPGSRVHLAADRYSYAATVPWAVLAGGCATALLWTARRRRWTAVAVLAAVLSVTVPVAWGALTRRQIAVWHDPASLWNHAAAETPASAVARFNLAVVRERQGRLADAVTGYRFAANTWPGYAPFHVAVGRTLARCGQLGPALAELGVAVRLRPNDGEAHATLGRVLLASGDVRGAVAELERALALDPSLVTARRDLAVARERLASRATTAAVAAPVDAGCW